MIINLSNIQPIQLSKNITILTIMEILHQLTSLTPFLITGNLHTNIIHSLNFSNNHIIIPNLSTSIMEEALVGARIRTHNSQRRNTCTYGRNRSQKKERVACRIETFLLRRRLVLNSPCQM
jgi:hypothetical protein